MMTAEPFDPGDEGAVRAVLEAARAALLGLSQATTHDRAPVTLDQQAVGRVSRMDAMQMQAMAQASESRRQTALVRLDAALKRLDAGDYGLCAKCGEDVEVRRLTLDPATPLCASCAGAG